ncbi:MAG: hypothetical protein AB1483_07315 [Candidatus Zixiibacteriota bacterium]
MRPRIIIALTGICLLLSAVIVNAGDSSEDEFIQKYMNKIEKKHTKKLTWVSGYFALNRINRDNDYNKFASYETVNFTDATISWLGDAKTFGLDFGMMFNKRFAWSVGVEYWLKIGESLEGSYFYEPVGAYIENPSSEVHVYGASTMIQYYFYNPPKVDQELENISLRVNAGVGFYQAQWDVWSEYQNLNLATNTSDADNATFKDQALGFSFGAGADYPTRVFGLVLGVDFKYLYLNFDNVAWYNDQDEEIIASYTGDSDGRVDLGLSGFTGKLELKRFFSW